jgi:hypothetical protein
MALTLSSVGNAEEDNRLSRRELLIGVPTLEVQLTVPRTHNKSEGSEITLMACLEEGLKHLGEPPEFVLSSAHVIQGAYLVEYVPRLISKA